MISRKGNESKLLNKEIREGFRLNAKAFQDVLDEVPDLSPLQVIKMCIHMALQEGNYEDAARWAKELAEYKEPKMARKEVGKQKETKDLTDDELRDLISREGLE